MKEDPFHVLLEKYLSAGLTLELAEAYAIANYKEGGW